MNRAGAWILARLRQSILEVILLAVCAGLALGAENFFTAENLLIILRSVSMQGIIAFGMTMVIICGEIDLGVGSMVAFSGCLAAWLTGLLGRAGLPMAAAVPLAVAASLGAGGGIGALTGFLRNRFRVPTFITTLAWFTILKGLAGRLTGGFQIVTFPDWYGFLGAGFVLGIPFPALVFVAVFALSHFVMNHTAFGRSIYAVGGNAEAARLSGIPVDRIRVGVMVIVACLAVLGGVLNSSEIMQGTARTAEGWELSVISAVIIGGTSLMGGAGTVRGTLVGVVFLGVINNGMTQLNFSEYDRYIVQGALILAAVLLNQLPAGRKGA